MNLLNFVKRSLFFVLTVTICIPGYATELSEFWLDNKLLSKQAAGYVSGQDIFQVDFQPLDLTTNPVKLNIVFKKKNVDRAWEADMPKTAPSFESLPTYDTSKKLQAFVADLNLLKIQGDRVFSQEDYVQDVGNVKLIFRKKHIIQLFKFAGNKDWDVRKDPPEHKTKFFVQFGFEGDTDQDPKLEKEIYTLDHAESTSSLDGHWYLNGNCRFESVNKNTYKTVSTNNEKWAADNGIVSETYEELKHGKEPGQDEIIVLDPPASYQNLALKPADKKNRYFKFHQEHNEDLGRFIFANVGKVFQTIQKKWWVYEQEEVKTGTLTDLKNKNSWFDMAAIVRATKTELPCVKLGSTLANSVQFVRNENFNDNQFYLLREAQPIPEGFRQVWLEQKNYPETVSINIVRMKEANGTWRTLSGFPTLVPAVANGQVTMDITPHVASFTDEQWENLKNYMIIAYWLEGKEPILKCNVPINLTNVQDLAISKSITAVLKGAPCLKIDFDRGVFFVKRGQDKWSISYRGDYDSRNKLEDTEWHYFAFWPVLISLIKERPDLHQLDFRNFDFPNQVNHKDICIFLSKSEQITSVLMKSLTRAKCQEIKLSDEEALKLLAKVQGLEELNLPKMTGLDKMDFPKVLAQNKDTLKHLDLTDASFSDEKGEAFVKEVCWLHKLESLKLIGFYLSNGNTEGLAKALCPRHHSKLREIHLALPYFGPLVAFEMCEDLLGKPLREGGILNYGKVALGVPLTAFCGVVFCPFLDLSDAVNPNSTGNLATYRTLYHLRQIGSLERLKLKAKGLLSKESGIRNLFSKRLTIEFAE
jgi:hypothetical protein